MNYSNGIKSLSSSTNPNQIKEKVYPRVRSKVLNILSKRLSEPVKIPEGEDQVVNAIIMEYLNWVGYRHTAEMMKKETKLACASDEGVSLCHQVRHRLEATISYCIDYDEPVIFPLISDSKR